MRVDEFFKRKNIRNFFDSVSKPFIYIYSSEMLGRLKTFIPPARPFDYCFDWIETRERQRERETKTKVPLTRFQLSIEITFSPTFPTNTHRLEKKDRAFELSNGSPLRLQKFDTNSPWQPILFSNGARHSRIFNKYLHFIIFFAP